jgi:hypothetical protein
MQLVGRRGRSPIDKFSPTPRAIARRAVIDEIAAHPRVSLVAPW